MGYDVKKKVKYKNIHLYHHHEHSWTVIGEKPV